MKSACHTCCLLLVSLFVLSLYAEDWPRFRGPHGTGESRDTRVPLKWDATAIAWKKELRGKGQSSPVIWKEKLFLTSASRDGKTRYVFCYDKTNGKLIWEKKVLRASLQITIVIGSVMSGVAGSVLVWHITGSSHLVARACCDRRRPIYFALEIELDSQVLCSPFMIQIRMTHGR